MIVTACIPARYSSVRLPGKPLLKIGDKTMIEWVYRACNRHPAIDNVVVLTDDVRIQTEVEKFGGNAVLTSVNAINGTRRIGEVLDHIQSDVILNIQGDEPGISQKAISLLMGTVNAAPDGIATVAQPIHNEEKMIHSQQVKVVLDKNDSAMYFSRSIIPAVSKDHKRPQKAHYLKHIGLYAFRKSRLKELIKLPSSHLGLVENLEQLDWLYNGYKIKVGVLMDDYPRGVDTLEDLQWARENYNQYYGR